MKGIKDNRLHYTFSPSGRFAGWIFMLMGMAVIINLEWWGILLLLFGAFFALTRTGVIINFDHARIREYSVLFGFKFGQWKKLGQYEIVRIYSRKKSYITYSWSNRQHQHIENVFEIELLKKYREKGLVIDKSYSLDEAREKAEKYQKLLKKINQDVST